MSELNLIVSQDHDALRLERLVASLSARFEIGETTSVSHRSEEATSFIRLLGECATWTVPLGAAATVYLSTLAKHAADATWSGTRALLRSKKVKPLADVATALAEAAGNREANVVVSVGLSMPDAHFGSTVAINPSHSPEQVARVLATFVLRADEVRRVIEAEVAAGRGVMPPVELSVDKAGALRVRWKSKSDLSIHEKLLS